MSAHAQHGSDLFLQGTGLQVFVDNEAESETPPGWTEMLSTMTDAFGELVEHAATVRQAVDTAEIFISEFSHPLDGHAELRPQAERCLELMRQRLAGLALAVIGAMLRPVMQRRLRWQIVQPPAYWIVTGMTLRQRSK